jgi:cupin fold WbuC family metalloprotein
MRDYEVPVLLNEELKIHFELATNSIRKRSPKILHKKGAYLNQVFNFILKDSYMHPHLHPGKEKIEKMYLIKGSFALILFNEVGQITQKIILEEGKLDFIEVPAFTWHTYVMLSDEVIIYETMDGIYEIDTWKKMASWAPKENSLDAENYLEILKNQVGV